MIVHMLYGCSEHCALNYYPYYIYWVTHLFYYSFSSLFRIVLWFSQRYYGEIQTFAVLKFICPWRHDSVKRKNIKHQFAPISPAQRVQSYISFHYKHTVIYLLLLSLSNVNNGNSLSNIPFISPGVRQGLVQWSVFRVIQRNTLGGSFLFTFISPLICGPFKHGIAWLTPDSWSPEGNG